MATLLGCIADDFTGATDLAGLLARSGAKVSLRIGIPSEPANPQDTAPFEIIALKCRTAPVDEAVVECKEALAWLKQTGASRFFWKYCSTFDSTSIGNIGPVAEALMNDTGAEQIIYCPAFPENGRSVYMGNLFVGRQLLAESPMKDHPLTPMRDSNLMRLLEPQVSGKVGQVDHLTVAQGAQAVQQEMARLRREGIVHVIPDAVVNRDLYTLAEACRDMPLMSGGSALAMPLPELFQRDGLFSIEENEQIVPMVSSASLVLSGSCSAMTRKQVNQFLRNRPGFRLEPLSLSKSGIAEAEQWLRQQSLENAPIIYATAEPEHVCAAQEQLGTENVGKLIEDALAELAIIARDMGARRFVIAGGETSGAITKALGVSKLDIGAEIVPGVPWCYGKSDEHEIAITLKSGNFGSEDFFEDALSRLSWQ